MNLIGRGTYFTYFNGRVIRKLLISLYVIILSQSAQAVNYIYPTPQGGFTTFVLGGNVDASTSDSLSFNGDSTFATNFWARIIGTGDVSFLLNGVGSATMSLVSGGIAAYGVSVQHQGDFTIPAGLTIDSTHNSSATRVTPITTGPGTSTTIINNGTLTANANGGASSYVYGIDAATYTRNINNTGTITVNVPTSTPPIVSGVQQWQGTTFDNSGTVTVTCPGGASGTLAGLITLGTTTVTNSGTVTCTGPGGYGFWPSTFPNPCTFYNSGNVTGNTGLRLQGSTLDAHLRGGIVTGSGGNAILGLASSPPTMVFDGSVTTTIAGNIFEAPFTVEGGATAAVTGDVNSSSFTVNNLGTINITGNISNSNVTLDAGATATLSGNIATATSVNVNNTTFTVGGNVSGVTTITVGGSSALTINGTCSTSGLSNAGTITFKNTFTPSGTVTNTGVLAFDDTNAALGGDLTGSGAGSIILGNATATNFTLNNSISNIPTLRVKTGSTLTANAGGAISGVTSLIMEGTVTNNGSLSLGSGVNVSGTGALINNVGKTLTISGVTFSNSGLLTNNGILCITQDSTLAGRTITTSASGVVQVSGRRTISAASYTNNGAQNFTITSEDTFDSLTCNCTADLTNAQITVTSNLSETGSSVEWPIFSATTLNPPTAPISLPTSDFLNIWGSYVAGNTIYVTLQRSTYSSLADTTLNQEVAQVIDEMSNNITNSGQQELVNIFSGLNSSSAVNAGLQQMIPNQNYDQQTVQLQGAIFSRIETRVASLKNSGRAGAVSYAAGDISHDTAVWISGLGSSSRQRPRGTNQGYKSSASGFVCGIDHINGDDNVFGVAFGNSNSSIRDQSNADFTTKVIGYHGMAYASCNLHTDKFLEWLVTGNVNRNRGTRSININNNNLTTNVSFNNWQLASRINYGKNIFISENVTLSPLALLQYSFINKPAYTEEGSVAALNIQQKGGENGLAIGTGMRLAFGSSNWWSMGARQIRALVTYDTINPHQDTISSFVVGSNTFVTTSNPARLAFRLGVDLGFEIASGLVAELIYDYEIRKDFIDHSGMLKFKYLF